MTRRTLTVRSAATTALIESLPVARPEKIGDLHCWTEDMIASARRYSSSRLRGGGMFSARLLTKAEARAALARAITELEAV